MDNSDRKDTIDELFLTAENGSIYQKVIERTERRIIIKALKRSFGNQSIAAKILGMNRNTLRAKIRKLEIDHKQYRI